MVKVKKKQNFVNIYVIKWHNFVLQGVLMYLNCTNMYPLGFTGLIECRLLNIFKPGVCPVWIMWRRNFFLLSCFALGFLSLAIEKVFWNLGGMGLCPPWIVQGSAKVLHPLYPSLKRVLEGSGFKVYVV